MVDKRCIDCPAIAECNIAVGYGSVICTINKMRSGKTKETIVEHGYYNCHNLTCRRRCEEDGYRKGIQDFYDKILNFEDYIKAEDIDVSCLLYAGRDITDMIVKIKNELVN